MKKKIEMEVKNPNAAGIDIGSRSHFVAVGQKDEEVKEFGVYHSDHIAIVTYLQSHQIKTIAMESTGSYWQSLYVVLLENNFDVILVPGSQTRGFRKTDVKDARQLQQLHSLGIVSSCFLPDNFTNKMRELCRHRKTLVSDAARFTNRMQKCLRMMNLRLDVVLADITGVSGMKIIKAILEGQRDGSMLATLADSRVRKSKETIADALQGNFQDQLLYQLKDNLEAYEFLQSKINGVDKKIAKLGEEVPIINDIKSEEVILTKKQIRGKNQPQIPIQRISYQLYGTDLSAIKGVSVNTLLTLVSEVGSSINKFRNSKSFVSWLRLAPNNKISGGKKLSSRTPKGSNPLAIALRDAANVIGNQKTNELNLVSFFKKIAFKKGRGAAITATARKLATIIFNMIQKKEPYNPHLHEAIKMKIKAKKMDAAKVLLKKSGFIIIDNEGVIMS